MSNANNNTVQEIDQLISLNGDACKNSKSIHCRQIMKKIMNLKKGCIANDPNCNNKFQELKYKFDFFERHNEHLRCVLVGGPKAVQKNETVDNVINNAKFTGKYEYQNRICENIKYLLRDGTKYNISATLNKTTWSEFDDNDNITGIIVEND